jgi:hypothetical protein
MEMSYFNTTKEQEKATEEICNDSKVIKNMTVTMNIAIPIIESKEDNVPNINLQFDLSNLAIKLDPLLYVRLTSIWNCIVPSEKFEIVTKQLFKKADLADAQLKTIVTITDSTSKQGRIMSCALKGSYLYFYYLKEGDIISNFHLLNATINCILNNAHPWRIPQ